MVEETPVRSLPLAIGSSTKIEKIAASTALSGLGELQHLSSVSITWAGMTEQPVLAKPERLKVLTLNNNQIASFAP